MNKYERISIIFIIFAILFLSVGLLTVNVSEKLQIITAFTDTCAFIAILFLAIGDE